MGDQIDNSALLTLQVLPNYIGCKYSLLLRQLGYKTLGDLSAVMEVKLSELGGFGQARMRLIKQALTDHGLEFRTVPAVDLLPRIHSKMVSWTAELDERATSNKSLPPSGAKVWSQASSQTDSEQDHTKTRH